MASVITRGTNFPAEIVSEMFSKVGGHSALAKMTGAMPLAFNGNTVFTFSMDHEISIVGENAAKVNGGGEAAPVVIRPIKVEYGLRVSDEFKYGSEETQLDYMRQFADGFAKKLARGLDIMAMHGVNPYSGTSSSLITSSFDSAITQTVTIASGDSPDDNIETAVGLVTGNDYDCSGVILAPAFRTALAALKVNGVKQYPELSWGGNPGTLNGLKADANSTLSFGSSKDRALVGNFEAFKWGYAKELPLEVIEYGNPDNDTTAGDLKGHNQVYLRSEAYLGWGIMDPNAFAFVKTA